MSDRRFFADAPVGAFCVSPYIASDKFLHYNSPVDLLVTPDASELPVPLKIFISYRRKTWAFTDRLYDELSQYPDLDLFMDRTSIDQADFEKSIVAHLHASHVVLVVLTELTFAPDRIHHDDDWVRREIALALEWDKPIVFVRVDGLVPPPPGDLPENIRQVTRMQGIPFYADFFDAAVQKLADFIGKIAPPEVLPVAVPMASPESGEPAPIPASAATFEQALRLFEAEDFEKAVFLLTALRDAGYRPKSRHLSVESLLDDAVQQRDRVLLCRAIQLEYDEIALAAESKSRLILDRARAAWADFCQTYPDYADCITDDKNLIERLKSAPIENKGLKPLVQTPVQTPPKPSFTLPLLEWVPIPAGDVTIEFGNWQKDKNDNYIYVTERTQVYPVEAFSISKYPVTNVQYQAFVDAPDGYRDAQWWNYSEYARQWRAATPEPQAGGFKGDKRPRENVTWYAAIAFCRWLSAKTGLAITLPTETQWQRAAQGDTGWAYPWGDMFDKSKCNTSESGIGETTDVDRYGKDGRGFSPYGVYDLSGNVWEWCLNTYDDITDTDINRSDTTRTAVRGGSWYFNPELARAAARNGNCPVFRLDHRGFRLVSSAPH